MARQSGADRLSSFLQAVEENDSQEAPAAAPGAGEPQPGATVATTPRPGPATVPASRTEVRLAAGSELTDRLGGSPRQAIIELGWKAQDEASGWPELGVRLPAVLAARLTERLAADKAERPAECRRSRKNHYIAAALMLVPDDARAAAEMGMRWRRAHRGEPPPKSGTGYGVPPVLDDKMRLVAATLGTVSSVHVWEVEAAAVDDLLNALDAEA